MSYNLFNYEKESEWECRVFGSITIRPTEKGTPNWFRRKLHEILLGVRWSKAKTPPRQVAVGK